MSSPIVGRNANVYINGSLAGYATGVTVGINVDLIKEYVLGSEAPSVLEAGNQSYPVSIDMLYVDKTNADIVKAGNAISLEVHPAGSGASNEKYVLNDVILTSWEMTVSQDGVILESVSGEAKSITLPS